MSDFRAEVRERLDALENQNKQNSERLDRLDKRGDRLEAQYNRMQIESTTIAREINAEVKAISARLNRFELDVLNAQTQAVKNRNDIISIEERIARLEAA